MAIQLNDNIEVKAPKPSEYRYFHPDNRPWLSVAEVNSTIPSTERHPGLVVFVVDTKYIYKDGIADVDLILDNDGGTQDLQSVLENGAVALIDPRFEAGIVTNTISSLNGDIFEIPQDEFGSFTLATREWVADNINGETNLAYTASPTNGTVTSDTGTDATIPLADGTNAGLISPAEKTKLTGIANNANNYVHPNHTGDVTSLGDGAQTITNGAVTNAKFRNSTAHTVVGRAGSGNGSVADITLGNDTILGRQGSGNVEALSVAQVQSILNFDTKQNNSIYITSNTTAVNNGRYIANGTLTVTDIVSPVAGSNYEVVVRGGSVTVGGTTYREGATIRRVHNGTAWINYAYIPNIPAEITLSSNVNASSLVWNDSEVNVNVGSTDRTITIDVPTRVVINKVGTGTLTILQGSGRTLILQNSVNQIIGNFAIARIMSNGTNDVLNINDAFDTNFVRLTNMIRVVVPALSFTGNPRTTTVTISPAFPDANYTVVPETGEFVSGHRITAKTTSGFTIAFNQSTALTQDVSLIIYRA